MRKAPLGTFEGHDGDLDPRAVQPPQPLGLSLVVLAEVEARGEDPQTEVGVPFQKIGHVPGTVIAGAPRGEPSDAVAPARVQVPVGDVAQEEQFHVAPGLRREQSTLLRFPDFRCGALLPPPVIFVGCLQFCP